LVALVVSKATATPLGSVTAPEHSSFTWPIAVFVKPAVRTAVTSRLVPQEIFIASLLKEIPTRGSRLMD
jgi:hypothetical protein